MGVSLVRGWGKTLTGAALDALARQIRRLTRITACGALHEFWLLKLVERHMVACRIRS
jgi:hypothetical protein